MSTGGAVGRSAVGHRNRSRIRKLEHMSPEMPCASGPVAMDRQLVAYELHPGNGVELLPASRERSWMNSTRERFANRCLPLLMANQAGWLVVTNARAPSLRTCRRHPKARPSSCAGHSLWPIRRKIWLTRFRQLHPYRISSRMTRSVVSPTRFRSTLTLRSVSAPNRHAVRMPANRERLFLMDVSPGIRGSDCDWAAVFRGILARAPADFAVLI
jgi:hypothetical protein